MSDKRFIRVLDMTRLMNKEILLYSLFDIAFKSPIRLMFGVYSILLLLIWALPIYMVIGFENFNVYWAALMFVPPFAIGNYMAKPVWGGKSFYHFAKAYWGYITTPKQYYDGVHRKDLIKDYTTDSFISVSRKDDIRKLKKGKGKK